MADHKLMPKHGEAFAIELEKCNRQFHEILVLQKDASLGLVELMISAASDPKKVNFPCRQCILDISLQFRDLADILAAVVDDKNVCK